MTWYPVSHHVVGRAHHPVILRKGCVAHDHVMRQVNPKTNLVIASFVKTRGVEYSLLSCGMLEGDTSAEALEYAE